VNATNATPDGGVGHHGLSVFVDDSTKRTVLVHIRGASFLEAAYRDAITSKDFAAPSVEVVVARPRLAAVYEIAAVRLFNYEEFYSALFRHAYDQAGCALDADKGREIRPAIGVQVSTRDGWIETFAPGPFPCISRWIEQAPLRKRAVERFDAG